MRNRRLDVPITSKERALELKKEIKERNRLNRSRAKAQERKVAKDLGGIRTPMSGASQFIKGDVSVELHPREYLLIECKLSDAKSPEGEPLIRVQLAWLAKMIREAELMRAKMSALIVKWHGSTEMAVIMKLTDLEILGFSDFEITFDVALKSFVFPQSKQSRRIKIAEYYGAVPYDAFKSAIERYRNT